ncbi:ABC transporter ATP-binding protein [Actinoplanes couchii]|uniref:ABC transporter n=1 Tax=Actinoplanes couchii TaxID=403638 RepID=A0ABQ3XB80_9ACTN|nr:ATP-binding cassette domain-containing protein [Actinoplanes couchii]MDR6323199.1 ABC-2 type transport system ATP-binding protein [Actinoplanes couchii]GID55714.1 ABC transporter [Actinoplanes couchii]
MIQTRELTKRFKDVRAVDGLDLTVARGELVALLGPNGAGKSTTLRMLTTLIPPTSGSATVAGFDVVRQQREVRLRIGYIGQGNGAGHSQRGRDELISQGRAYGMGVRAARARAGELIDSLGLGEVADRTVSTLSGGQRRRLDIAMGLIHAPELLFLDEPSTGLDPQNRANLQEHIVRLRAEHGTTIVLTTHYLDEADSMAERVVVIDHGRIVADDTPRRLKAVHVGDRVILGFASESAAIEAARETGGTRHGAEVRITGEDGPRIAARSAVLGPISIEVVRPTLDDVFLTLTGTSLREGGAAELVEARS